MSKSKDKPLHPIAQAAIGIAASVGGKAVQRAAREGFAGLADSLLEDVEAAADNVLGRTRSARNRIKQRREQGWAPPQSQEEE